MIDGRIAGITFDVGGPFYPDSSFLSAAIMALDELRARQHLPPVDVSEVDKIYDQSRANQSGGLRKRLAARFLGDQDLAGELQKCLEQYWSHPPGTLYPDVLPMLESLPKDLRIGILANQGPSVFDELNRDGVGSFVDVWAVSGLVGYEKPNLELFRWALSCLEVPASAVIHVGNRLDTDIRPAKAVGMRAVWLVRGEAPDNPTEEQIGEPDATIWSLDELVDLLVRLGAVAGR